MIKIGEILPLIAALSMIMMVLQGCDLHEETKLNQRRLQVESQNFSEQKMLPDVTPDYVQALAHYYSRYGDGPMNITVAYDSQSRSNTAMNAANEMGRIKHEFHQSGIANLNAQILPVNQQGDIASVLISFDTAVAKPPENCGVLSGFDDTNLDIDPEYGLGCTVETVFAKQISRPKDLKGQDNTDTATDGRRSSNRIEVYRTGEPNEPIGGLSSSGSN